MLPVVVGFVGNLDGRHVVSIAEGRESTVVVLHHEGGMPGAEHRHTVLSKVLVAFSQSDRETMDHLLVFLGPGRPIFVNEKCFRDLRSGLRGGLRSWF